MPNDEQAARDANADMREAMTQALNKQPRYVQYPEYKKENDFNLWVTGYYSRIQNAFGFNLNEARKVENEIIRSISGKLAVGPTLDAYNRLPDGDKTNYQNLIKRLTDEYTDPQQKKKFNSSTKFNVRKKAQSIKDFAQDIKTDMDRYSDTPATVLQVSGGIIANVERERQGVRRFIQGIRSKKGKPDPDFKRHLEYHLQDEKELRWDNAIKVAMRYEMVYDEDDDDDKEDSETSSDEEVEAVDTKKSKKKKKGKGGNAISALADQVHENQMKIMKLETAQERMSTMQEQLSKSQIAANTTLQEISAKLDMSLTLHQTQKFQQLLPQQPYYPTQQQQSRPPQQQNRPPQQQYRSPQQQQQGRPPQQQQPRQQTPQNGGAFRANPARNTWNGAVGQPRQGSFGFARQTPATFPASTVTRTTTGTSNSANMAAAATVAAVEDSGTNGDGDYVYPAENDCAADPTAVYNDEATEDGAAAAVDNVNFY